MINTDIIREDFPILHTRIHSRPLVYLDNAATMQCPTGVQNAVLQHYGSCHANVHRGIHSLSETATANMERARVSAAGFTGASDSSEIIFTSGTTESVNIAARLLEHTVIHAGDEIIVSGMEHHSNLIPWQELAKRTGAVLKILPVCDNGTLDMKAFAQMLSQKTRLVCVCLVSNVLGTVNPVQRMAELSHKHGALIFVDAAQAVRHCPLNAHENGYDMLAFSGHKMGAFTGTGVLYIKKELQGVLHPCVYGGGTVDTVTYENAVFTGSVSRFEAGTPNIAGIASLEAAIVYLNTLGLKNIAEYEKELIDYTEECLRHFDYVDILGEPYERAGVLSFNITGLHCYDTAALLDRLGIAVRSGHHCAEPLLARFGLDGIVRVSPAFYNTKDEIDALCNAICRIHEVKR